MVHYGWKTAGGGRPEAKDLSGRLITSASEMAPDRLDDGVIALARTVLESFDGLPAGK